MNTMQTPVLSHMESFFGRIEQGWMPNEWVDHAIQVVEFKGGTLSGITVLSTLGLSGFELSSPVSRKQIRQELFLMIKDGQMDARLAAVLDQVAREQVRSDIPVLRGDVISKQGSLLNEHGFVSLYATVPVYYPNSFWTFHDAEEGDVIFAWLLPIMESENSYVARHGWSAFEKILDEAKVDLFDLNRSPLV